MRIKNLEINGTYKQSQQISFVLGVYSGYNHNNKKPDGTKYTIKAVVKAIMDLVEEHCDEIGEVSFTVEPVKCVYRTKHGCPKDGEDAYRISTVYNPAYGMDESDWEDAAIVYAYYLAKHFNQSTLTIEYLDGGGYDDEFKNDFYAGFYILYLKLDEVRVIEEKEIAHSIKNAMVDYLNKFDQEDK